LSNFATAIKEEITRLVRKELRRETEALKKASARYRSEIAALKRRIDDAEKALARAARAPRAETPVAAGTDRPVRFSAGGLRKLRERLGLSAADFGLLLEVSGQTVYNWESGSTRPSPETIRAIAAMRGIGKREAAARLAATRPA
jgi:DNA-binding transcriptional regulator YiaG